MANRFKGNKVYSGELVFGGCGCLDTNKITILKRTKGWIVFMQEFIKKIFRVKRDYAANFGDCIHTRFDDFFANSLEPTIEPF